MINKQTHFSNNFWFNTYISNLDLVYKYHLKNKYQIPKINEINICLNLNEISITDSNKKTINSIQNYRNIYFFFFCLFSIMPSIKAKTIYNSQGSYKSVDSEYILKLNFISSSQINFFLFFFFIEHWNNIIKNNENITKITIPKTLLNPLKKKIPLNILYNFDIFYTYNQTQLLKEDSFIYIAFEFQNLTIQNYNTTIRNLPLFWKNV